MMRTVIEPEGMPAEQPLAVIRIATVEDYEYATARVAQLAGAPDDSSKAASQYMLPVGNEAQF